MSATFVNGIFPGELTPNVTVGGCIDIFENVWENPDITIKTVEELASDKDSGVNWIRAGTIGAGVHQDMRTNSLMDLTTTCHTTNNPHIQGIHNKFYMLLLAGMASYSRKYEMHMPFVHEGYQLLRYGEGQEYKAHSDAGPGINRVVSALIYLNEDYAGGELEFVNFGIKVKPKAGMMILFPSDFAYRHIAHPIRKGKKYSLVTWIRDGVYQQ